jgi:hypothetical protein
MINDDSTLAEYLGQGEVWSSKDAMLNIADMDEVYRRRATEWLLRNAEGLLQQFVLEQYDAKEELPTLGDKLGWADIRPYSWIKRTPLYLAVSKGIPTELLRKGGR